MLVLGCGCKHTFTLAEVRPHREHKTSTACRQYQNPVREWQWAGVLWLHRGSWRQAFGIWHCSPCMAWLLFYLPLLSAPLSILCVCLSHSFGKLTSQPQPKWVKNKRHCRASLKSDEDQMMKQQKTLRLPTKRKLHLKRKYQESLNYGFTATGNSQPPSPLCVIRGNWLSNKPMKPKLFSPHVDQVPCSKRRASGVFQRKTK